MGKGPDHGADRFRERERKERDYKEQLPGEDDKPLPEPVDPIHGTTKPDRNAPCACGSGKKYKKCCGKPD